MYLTMFVIVNEPMNYIVLKYVIWSYYFVYDNYNNLINGEIVITYVTSYIYQYSKCSNNIII